MQTEKTTKEMKHYETYIFDLDGETGTYSYSQASGADFAWLDEYDGELVTLYMTVLNAKMSASGGNWRLSPVYVDPTPYVDLPRVEADEAMALSAKQGKRLNLIGEAERYLIVREGEAVAVYRKEGESYRSERGLF